jgi:signal transduction histidine kinase/CheY-like chemotaxis protein
VEATIPAFLLQIASLLAALIHLGLGTYTLIRDARSRIGWLFFLLCLSFFVWSASYGLFVGAPDLTLARSWDQVGTLGWAFAPALVLHIHLGLTMRPYRPLSPLWLVALYAPGTVIALSAAWGPAVASTVVRTKLGWAEVMDETGFLYWFWIIYYLSMCVTALALLWRWSRRTLLMRERRKAWVMFTSGVSCLTIATLLAYAEPLVLDVAMPGLSHFALLFWSGGIALAMERYHVHELTPQSVSEDVLAGMSEAVLLLDVEDRVLYANAAAGVLLSRPHHALVGRRLDRIGARGLVAFLEDLRPRLSSHPKLPSEHRILFEGQGVRQLLVQALPMADRFQQLYGVALIMSDVTEQHQLREQLERADSAAQRERLASIGMLAASVAHEINNPLGYVMANLELLGDALRDEGDRAPAELGGVPVSELIDASGEALEGAGRVRDIVADLRSFSRADRPDATRAVDVVEVLDSALSLARNELRHRARVVRELQALPKIEANDGRLCQVFLNLLINAAHAIPPGHSAEHRVTVRSRQEREWLVVEVEDTGAGIHPRELPRIFEPFHSTRGEGLGLGLPISRRIIEGLGGRLEASTELGRGSCFQVFLPRSLQVDTGQEVAQARNASETVSGPPAPPAPSDQPQHRVLIVDDEAALLRVMKRVASSRYHVLTATSGWEAQALLRGGARADLVVSDLMMADGSGMELYAWISHHRPALAETMLFLSGGTFSDEAATFAERFGDRLLTKPFGGAELLAALERALD